MNEQEKDFLDIWTGRKRRTAADFVVQPEEPRISDATLLGSAPPAPDGAASAAMPTGLPLAGLFLGGLGSLIKAGAQQAQGRAAKMAADLSADFSERAAADAVQRGNMREFEVTSRGEKILADQLTAQTNSGSDANVGGQLTTRQASRGNLDFDRALVRRNAAMEAYGFRARAQAQRQEGEYAQEAADTAATGTFLSGIADFVGGAGKFLIDNPEILAGA